MKEHLISCICPTDASMCPELLLARGKPCLPQAGSNAERQLGTLQSGLWLIYKDGFNPVVTKTRPVVTKPPGASQQTAQTSM